LDNVICSVKEKDPISNRPN